MRGALVGDTLVRLGAAQQHRSYARTQRSWGLSLGFNIRVVRSEEAKSSSVNVPRIALTRSSVHYDKKARAHSSTTIAPSYVNELASVPLCDATAAIIAADIPPPAGCVHTSEVVEIQLVVVHCVEPVDAVGDELIEPKFVPDIVSVEPPVVGPFTGLPVVTTAAARHPRLTPYLLSAVRGYPEQRSLRQKRHERTAAQSSHRRM